MPSKTVCLLIRHVRYCPIAAGKRTSFDIRSVPRAIAGCRETSAWRGVGSGLHGGPPLGATPSHRGEGGSCRIVQKSMQPAYDAAPALPEFLSPGAFRFGFLRRVLNRVLILRIGRIRILPGWPGAKRHALCKRRRCDLKGHDNGQHPVHLYRCHDFHALLCCCCGDAPNTDLVLIRLAAIPAAARSAEAQKRKTQSAYKMSSLRPQADIAFLNARPNALRPSLRRRGLRPRAARAASAPDAARPPSRVEPPAGSSPPRRRALQRSVRRAPAAACGR